MTENMKKFIEVVSADKELGLKVSNAQKDMLMLLAKENGIELKEEDFAVPTGELSDDELDAVVGGGECYCAVGGGGTKDGAHPYAEEHWDGLDVCACVVAGFGYYGNGKERCGCAFAGGGSN